MTTTKTGAGHGNGRAQEQTWQAGWRQRIIINFFERNYKPNVWYAHWKCGLRLKTNKFNEKSSRAIYSYMLSTNSWHGLALWISLQCGRPKSFASFAKSTMPYVFDTSTLAFRSHLDSLSVSITDCHPIAHSGSDANWQTFCENMKLINME